MSKLRVTRYKSNQTKRSVRTHGKIRRVSTLPRLIINKSNKYIYVQISDDENGKILGGVKSKNPTTAGKNIAEKAIELKIKNVVFDRGIYKYHGQVRTVAEAAREAGLIF